MSWLATKTFAVEPATQPGRGISTQSLTGISLLTLGVEVLQLIERVVVEGVPDSMGVAEFLNVA